MKRDRRARAQHRRQYWERHDRDSYTCPNCGRGDERVEQFEVHHKDGNPRNGDPENLVALCHQCHLDEHDREPSLSLEEWKEAFLSMGSEA